MSAASRLLDRLSHVKATGPARWIACCPAHEDRSPSLSIRELDDARILLHCFAGCDAADVLGAVGLRLADLYPQRLPGHSYPATHSRIPAADLLAIISQEATLIGLLAADMLTGKTISEVDWQRLSAAASRIGRVRDYLRG